MNKLEELRKAAVEARKFWRWEELHAIERAIDIETGVLVETAETLPPAQDVSVLPWTGPPPQASAGDGQSSPDEPVSDEPSDDEPSDDEPSDDKPSSKKPAKRGKGK